MASLDKFTDTSAASLDSFQIEAPLVPVNNEKSNRNLAAYTAALSGNPDSVEATYLRAAGEMDQEGSSKTFEGVKKRANQQGMTKNRQALIDVLTDPSIPDEQKKASAIAVLDETNERYNVRNAVSEGALIDDSKDETVEAEYQRVSLASAIDGVNREKKQRQALLNKELAKNDPNILKQGVDFLEMMIPFAEGEGVGAVLKEAKGGDKSAQLKAIALIGEGKVDLRQMLTRLPPEERPAVTERIVDLINSSPGVVLADDNEFARADLLKTVLKEGHYSNTDRWIDNAIGLLDMSILGAPISRGTELVRGLRAAGRTEEAATTSGRAAEDLNATMPDDELRAAEDASEARISDRQLRQEEDTSEARIRARQQEMEQDPVRRAEDASERRIQARRAVMEDTDELRRLEDLAEEKAQKNSVRSNVQPVSLAQNYKDTNPEKARSANEVAGTSDEASEAFYGTSRVEAVANDELPEVAKSDGSVENKVSMPDRSSRNRPPPRPRVMDYADKNGAIYLTDAEKSSAATRVVHDFNNATGLTTRKEMNVPKGNEISGGVDVEVTYGPKDMGWSSGQDAVDLVKWSLRDYGVKDSDITLMQRVGSEYKPVKVSEAREGGDYLVKVNYPYKLSASDVEDWDDLDVKNNFFDRVPHLGGTSGGSFQRHILDAHSMLHPNITLGANVAVDKSAGLEKILLEQTQEFSQPYGKLPKDRQQVLEQKIKQMNYEGKFPPKSEMKAQGMTDEEVNILRAWRDTWDTMYWLENSDLVKSLRNRGFGVIEDSSTDTRVFAKQMSRQQAGSHQRVYDLTTGKMRNVDSEELAELYDKGGAVARMRQPMRVGDEAADTAIVSNKPDGSYIRGLRDDDSVLNYREGYYSVYYTDPHFIVKVERDARGNELYRRAVSTAGTMKEANLKARRLAATDGAEYIVRGDVKKIRGDSDQNWDLQMASGRTAQRIRGERLEDASSPITDPSHNNIMGPVDSLITSARSVSSRVPMRDYLEATKQRAIEQYGDVFPKNKFDQPTFPASSSDIVSPGKEASRHAADARTTVEYIKFLEDGYINSMDEGIKSVFRSIADIAGTGGAERLEKAARAASEVRGPTSVGRNIAFTLYLALNPLRQAIIQSHQSVQLFAIAPGYVSRQLSFDLAAMMQMKVGGEAWELSAKATGRSKEELKDMWQAFQESGLSASIDKQNLVRGSLTELAENSRIAGRKNPIARGVALSRKAGFDLGEEANMTTSWLTHYNMAVQRKGSTKLTQRELDEVSARARDYTYNMNRAGDMPYNENFLGMVFQFMQVPHKALTQMTTNRNLTLRQKVQLATFNTLAYGAPPASFMYATMGDILPEDGEFRELISQGFEGYFLNKGLSLAYGEDVQIDFTGLAASDTSGLFQFLTSLATTDAGEIVAATPAGGLLFGGNARLTNFAKEAAQYFNFTDPVDLEPPQLSEVFEEAAKLSSGYSNYAKARVALEYGKRYNAYGGVVDSTVNTPEAIARLFGFGTLDEAKRYYVTGQMYEKRKGFKEDVQAWYKELKRNLTKEDIKPGEVEWFRRVNNAMLSAFKDSPESRRIILQQMRYDAENGDASLVESIRRSTGIMNRDELEGIINEAPVSDDNREALIRTLDYIDSYEDE